MQSPGIYTDEMTEGWKLVTEAVQAEGRRVILWFIDNGLSPALRRAVDYYFDAGELLFQDYQSTWNFLGYER